MRNRYSDSSPEATYQLAQQIHRVATNPADWGLTAAQLTQLQSTSVALQTGIANAVSAKATAVSAIQGRDQVNQACKAAISDIAASIYVNKSLTPGQISSLGLAPRKTTRTKVVPVTPTDLVASIERNGNVLLRFQRAGNAAGVIFRVEAQTSTDGPWAFVTETTATRLSLSGYLPGEWTSFRIVATKNGLDAPASDVAVIYPTGATAAKPALRLAA